MTSGTKFRATIDRTFHMRGHNAGLGVELAIEVLDGSPEPARGPDSAATKNKNIGIGCVTVLIAIFLLSLLIHFL
jgi:hypothetical protein